MLMNMLNLKLSTVFSVVVVSCISLGAGNSNMMNSCVETEKQALLKFKGGFIDEEAFLSTWKSEIDCCQWEGVSCDTGHVLELLVEGNMIRFGGNINSLCELHHLNILRLNDIDFEGMRIPKCIGSLSQLIELQLAATGLVGTIPQQLGNLSNLQILDLETNYNLTANDLHWVSHLSSLTSLSLQYVDLSGAIDWQSSLSSIVPSLSELYLVGCGLMPHVRPQPFSHINSSTSLTFLHLEVNHLDSSILPWVSNVSKVLESLFLSNNSLQHIIPQAFSNMNSLQNLDISYNFLQQIDAETFANMASLSELDLSNNCLRHIPPNAFTNKTSLEVLDLSFNYLERNIVNVICNLHELQALVLFHNKLSSQLSDWIKQLHCVQDSIETLILSENPFSNGPFPDLSKFSSLRYLFLANTNLYGSIPQSFKDSPHLVSMYLGHNKLSGPFPVFTGLSSLEELDLSFNELTEILPGGFGQLSQLLGLSLQSNKLKGVISEGHLSTLTSLEFLDVSHNLISFNISSKWIPSSQLETFYASSCILGPDFPAWLKFQKQLSYLDVSNGQISDSIPEWFWDISQGLDYMNISHNSIHGPLPKSITLPHYLYVWDLSFNKLHGSVTRFPLEFTYLILSNNMFSGSISSFCATSQSYLTYLDMSSNFLSGQLPDCWDQFSFLQVLNLAKNNFSGRIPHSIGTLEKIEILHLNNNKLSGEIPSFKPSSKLKFIDFGQNNLHGRLPTWIGHYLPNLIGLRLHANKLQGRLPASICSLVHLQILDLSQNNITGTIPPCLNNLTALSNISITRQILSYARIEKKPLYYILPYSTLWHQTHITTPIMEKATLAWKGQDVEYSKNLWLMTTIDLSCNYLRGEIPQSLITLLALASLNLSRNNFTGVIPNNVGEMKMLESLDLSCNSLSGDIPTSFSALTFLSYLNLSFNSLSGQIPQTTQLQTFNASSYIGNQGLCGSPLTQECSNPIELQRNNPNIDADKDDELISFGFYVCLVFGFIIGFWGVCGTLIFKLSWRRAYFQFFTDISDWIYVQIVVSRTRIMRRFQQ